MKFLKKYLSDRRTRAIVIAILAFFLLVLVYCVFFTGQSSNKYQPSEEEAKLATLLQSLEGVDEATVMISKEDGFPATAVVLFRGKDSLLLRNRILTASATALNLSPKCVQVYPSEG